MRRIMNEQLLISENNPIKARYYDYDRFFYPWHFHSQYELIFVRESYGCCFVGDHIEDYKAGDLFLFGSNLPHYMRSDDVYATPETPGRVQGTIIQFEENFMDYSFSHYPQFMQIHAMLERAGRGLKFSGLKGTPVGVLLENFPKEEGFRQITCLLEMLQELAVSPVQKLLASANYSETFPVFGDKRIDKVLSYIQSNYTQKLSLSGIAAMAHMNPGGFLPLFQGAVGKDAFGIHHGCAYRLCLSVACGQQDDGGADSPGVRFRFIDPFQQDVQETDQVHSHELSGTYIEVGR